MRFIFNFPIKVSTGRSLTKAACAYLWSKGSSIGMMHNAKYKTGGLAAAASAIGKVFVFTIKEPQERSGLFAVARSPSGSLTTKMVRFRHEVDTSGFSSQRKPVKKVADHSASYHAIRCVSTLRIISQTRWRHTFHRRSVQVLPSSKTCQKGFRRFIPSPSRFSA